MKRIYNPLKGPTENWALVKAVHKVVALCVRIHRRVVANYSVCNDLNVTFVSVGDYERLHGSCTRCSSCVDDIIQLEVAKVLEVTRHVTWKLAEDVSPMTTAHCKG